MESNVRKQSFDRFKDAVRSQDAAQGWRQGDWSATRSTRLVRRRFHPPPAARQMLVSRTGAGPRSLSRRPSMLAECLFAYCSHFMTAKPARTFL